MSSKKSFRRKIILAVLLVVGAVMWYVCHNYVNKKYPAPVVKQYNLGETFIFENAELTFTDFQILPRDEFNEKYNIDESKLDSVTHDAEKDAMFKVTVANPTQEPISVNLLGFMVLEGEGYSSYTDLMGLFHQMNPDESGFVELNPGEETSVWFPYTLYDTQFNKKDFANLENMPFHVVMSLYPVRTIVVLNEA